MPNTCIICGHVKGKDKCISVHRFPHEPSKRQEWLRALNITENDITGSSRICSRHFLHGLTPSLHIGKRFSSPKKLQEARGRRAVKRLSLSPIFQTPSTKHKRLTLTPASLCASSVAATPGSSTEESMSLSASISEPLLSSYGVHELPGYGDNRDIFLDTALAARTESLEAETEHLQSTLSTTKPTYFRVQQISGNDALTRFYTGFASYEILLAFFEFLGPAVYKL